MLIDNDIDDGPNGNSSYLIDIPNGGDVLIQGNRALPVAEGVGRQLGHHRAHPA